MSGQEQLFSAYRDLGIEQATHGQFRAHVVRIKKTVVVGRVPEAAAAR